MSLVETESNADNRPEDDEDSGQRTIWAVLSWIAVVLTLILNLVLVAIIVFRRTFTSLPNKGKEKLKGH